MVVHWGVSSADFWQMTPGEIAWFIDEKTGASRKAAERAELVQLLEDGGF